MTEPRRAIYEITFPPTDAENEGDRIRIWEWPHSSVFAQDGWVSGYLVSARWHKTVDGVGTIDDEFTKRRIRIPTTAIQTLETITAGEE